MSTAKYSAKSNVKHFHKVKTALKELEIRHGPFQKGIRHLWLDTHFYDLYDSPAIPFLILRLSDTDFNISIRSD